MWQRNPATRFGKVDPRFQGLGWDRLHCAVFGALLPMTILRDVPEFDYVIPVVVVGAGACGFSELYSP